MNFINACNIATLEAYDGRGCGSRESMMASGGEPRWAVSESSTNIYAGRI